MPASPAAHLKANSRAAATPRVMHITTVHLPFDQRIYHRECAALAQDGYEVVLLANNARNSSRYGVRLVSLGRPSTDKPGLKLFERWRRSRHAFQAASRLGADVYHVHDLELVPAALKLKRQRGARVIYDCHEDNVGFMRQKPQVPRILRAALAQIVTAVESKAARVLDTVVTADSGVQARFLGWGAKAVVIHNFPKLELFPAVTTPASPDFDLVYHGSIPRYHLEMCFRIDDALLAHHRHARWLLFGRFHDLAWAREQVKRRQAEDRFVLEGLVPHEEVASKVRRARLGIIPLPNLPKFQFNIPTKLFEFMALGLPVVLSDLPPSRPFAGDQQCALMIPPDDSDAYARAIMRLLDDPVLRERMGREGRRRIECYYNWGCESTKLLNLYSNLLAQ